MRRYRESVHAAMALVTGALVVGTLMLCPTVASADTSWKTTAVDAYWDNANNRPRSQSGQLA